LIATKSHPPPAAAGKPGQRGYLSFTAVALFQACPLRHYFRYILGLPEETISASLVLGSCIHASVQYHFEQLLAGNAAPDLDTLLDVFQDTWQSYQGKKIQFPKGETRDSLGRLADRMLRSFRASAFARPQGTILGIEEELQGELIPGLPDLLGRLDLIVDTPEALLITDFKTTRTGWSQSHVEEAAPQLLLYSELAKSLAGGKAIRLGFAVLSKAKQPELAFHPVPLDPHQMERTKKVVERVWHAMQAGQVYPRPSPINCPGCPYRAPCRKWKG
jgi:RecB family exonuclease